MAKLRAVIDSIEDVEEAFRPLYVQDEGDHRFYLDSDLDPRELNTLRTENKEKRKALADLKGKVPDDFDAEEWKKLKADSKKREREREEAEREKQKQAGDFEAREAKLKQKHDEELKAANERAIKYQKQRDKAIMDDAARKAISEAKGRSGLLLPHVLRRLRVDENAQGDAELVVLDETGDPAVADGRGSPLTLSKLIEEFKASDEFGVAFEGSGAAGGGAQPNAATRGNGATGRPHSIVGGMDLTKSKPEEKLKAIHSGKIPAGPPQARH